MRSNAALNPLLSTAPRPVMIFTALLVTAVSSLAFWPVASFVVTQDVDYRIHLMILDTALNGLPIGDFTAQVPHFLWHTLVTLLFRIVPGISLFDAALVVTVGLYAALALAILAALCWFLGRPGTVVGGVLYAALTLALMWVMPVNLFTPSNRYLGYIPIHAYHNPTIVALKPLALLLFLIACRALEPGAGARTPPWAAALVTLLGVMAKPNYALALVPALALVAGYFLLRRQGFHRATIFGGIVFVGVYLLAVQALMFGTGGFQVAPLAVFAGQAEMINPAASANLLTKFLLSVAFPAVVYALCWPQARRSVGLNLAWLTFGFGAAYTYLLAETGPRLHHANFTWSGQITLFVLFVMSAIFFVEMNRPFRLSLRLLVCGLILALHLVSGLAWYQIHVTTPTMGDIITGAW